MPAAVRFFGNRPRRIERFSRSRDKNSMAVGPGPSLGFRRILQWLFFFFYLYLQVLRTPISQKTRSIFAVLLFYVNFFVFCFFLRDDFFTFINSEKFVSVFSPFPQIFPSAATINHRNDVDAKSYEFLIDTNCF